MKWCRCTIVDDAMFSRKRQRVQRTLTWNCILHLVSYFKHLHTHKLSKWMKLSICPFSIHLYALLNKHLLVRLKQQRQKDRQQRGSAKERKRINFKRKRCFKQNVNLHFSLALWRPFQYQLWICTEEIAEKIEWNLFLFFFSRSFTNADWHYWTLLFLQWKEKVMRLKNKLSS